MGFQEHMWALTRSTPSKLHWGEVSPPDPGALQPGEVVLRTLAGGICGSDLPFFQGYNAPVAPQGTPGFPLHEIAGEVVATASNTLEIGAQVVGWATRQNGLAEYVVSADHSLHAYSAELSPQVAIMLQPLACVIYAAEQIGDVAGKNVAILGLGPIGVLFAHVLKTRGAAHVTGVDRVDRSDVAELFGIDRLEHSDVGTWAAGLDAADRPDVVVEAIGHQVETLTAAVEAAAYEGRVFYFGIPNDKVYPLPMETLLRKNMTLQAGVTALPHRSRVLADAERYLAAHPELGDGYLTSPFPFSESEAAFKAAVSPRTGQLKVTLTH